MATLLLGLARRKSRNVHDSNNHPSNTEQQTTIMTLPPASYNPEYAAPAQASRDEAPPPYTEVAPPEARIHQPQTRTPSAAPLRLSQRRFQTQSREPSQSQLPSRTSGQAQSPTRNPSQAQSPTRSPSQAQPRQEEPTRLPIQNSSQSKPPTRTQTQPQSQPQRSASIIRHQPTIPSYQQPQRSASVIHHQPTIPTFQQAPSQEPAGYVVVDAAPGLVVCDCAYKDGFGLAPKCRECERQARRGLHGTSERRRRRNRDGPIQRLLQR